MQTKYDIEITINNITNKGKMEINDDSITLYIDTQVKTVMYNTIKKNIVENGLLKLILNDDTALFIKSVQTNDINSFINLQKGDNYPIVFKTKEYYMKKYFRNGFITGFLIVFIYNINFMDLYVIIGCFFWGIIFGLIFLLVGNANTLKKDRSSSKCPHCQNELILTYGIGEFKESIFENQIITTTCNHCGNKLGIKYNHLYKLTPQNESEFEITVNPLKQEKQNIDTEHNNDENNFEKLEKLKELLDKNVITKEEFEEKKKEILNKL